MVSPDRIFATFNAYQGTQVLKAAVKLDVFTVIDNGNQSVATIASGCDASERGIRTLCDYLVIMEFLKKHDNNYSLTDESKLFLSRNSPAFVGGATTFLNSEMLMSGFNNLDEVVRRGGTLLDGEGSVNPENPMWVDFARSMAPMMQPAAMGIAKMIGVDRKAPLKILDVAAGHGVFGIAIAAEYPNATVTALDWPNVLKVAEENAVRAGVEERYNLLPGDAFDVSLDEKYDLILVTNFLHHFDLPTCEKFLKKMHAALKVDGRALTLEFVPNEDRVSPPAEAAFSLIMLASTRSGDAYTFAEYDRVFRAAGFSGNEIYALPGSAEHLIVSTK